MVKAKEFLRRGTGNDAAGLEQNNARGEKQGFAQIVSDKDNGLAEAAGQGAEFALKLGARDRIEGAERLIHQQNWRIGGKGAGNADALTLASGEFAGAAASEFRARIQANKLKHFINARGGAGRLPVFQRGYQGDVFCNRPVREERGFPKYLTNA